MLKYARFARSTRTFYLPKMIVHERARTIQKCVQLVIINCAVCNDRGDTLPHFLIYHKIYVLYYIIINILYIYFGI